MAYWEEVRNGVPLAELFEQKFCARGYDLACFVGEWWFEIENVKDLKRLVEKGPDPELDSGSFEIYSHGYQWVSWALAERERLERGKCSFAEMCSRAQGILETLESHPALYEIAIRQLYEWGYALMRGMGVPVILEARENLSQRQFSNFVHRMYDSDFFEYEKANEVTAHGWEIGGLELDGWLEFLDQVPLFAARMTTNFWRACFQTGRQDEAARLLDLLPNGLDLYALKAAFLEPEGAGPKIYAKFLARTDGEVRARLFAQLGRAGKLTSADRKR